MTDCQRRRCRRHRRRHRHRRGRGLLRRRRRRLKPPQWHVVFNNGSPFWIPTAQRPTVLPSPPQLFFCWFFFFFLPEFSWAELSPTAFNQQKQRWRRLRGSQQFIQPCILSLTICICIWLHYTSEYMGSTHTQCVWVSQKVEPIWHRNPQSAVPNSMPYHPIPSQMAAHCPFFPPWDTSTSSISV